MAHSEHAYAKFPITLSNYANNLDTAAKERYVEKLTYLLPNNRRIIVPDPYSIAKKDWKDDLSSWPTLTKGNIDVFITSCPGNNVKALSAYNSVVSGKVQNVYSFSVEEFTVLTAEVQPSMRTAIGNYKPWVICSKDKIYAAHCTCIAGLGEVCTHVAALLYKVQLASLMGINAAATEKKCEWNQSFTRKIQPAPMKEINLSVNKWADEPLRKKFRTDTVFPMELPPCSKEQISRLKEIAPEAVYFTSLYEKIDSSSTETASTEEDAENIPTMQILFARNNITTNECLRKFFNLEIISKIEILTRGQNNSLWSEQRRGRLTSSNFGCIIKRKKATKEFAEKFLNPQGGLNVPSINWGRSNEGRAIQEYIEKNETLHSNFNVNQSGLIICEGAPFLAASPDATVCCDCCGKGVVEVKCPYKHRDENPSCIVDKTFCLDQNGALKESHNYYAQVQGQMAIANAAYCDFVVWTTKGILVNRIPRDSHFWDLSYNILEQFFFREVAPLLRKL